MSVRRHRIKPILILMIISIVFMLITWGSAAGGPEDPPDGTGDTVPVKVDLKKIKFNADVDKDSIEVIFNPAEVSVKKTVPWSDQPKEKNGTPKTEFTHGQAFGLSMDLIIEEEDVEGGDVTLPVFAMEQYIIENRDVKKPPKIEFLWGATEFKFECVIAKLDVTYTMFRPDGKPVRAEVSLELVEFTPAKEQMKNAPRH